MNNLKNLVQEIFTKAEIVICVYITRPELDYQSIPIRPRVKFPKRRR